MIAWAVAALLLAAAMLCARARRAAIAGEALASAYPGPERRAAARAVAYRASRRFWALMAAWLVLLAADRALHGAEHLTDLAREFAIDRGWYEHRGGLQVAVMGMIPGSC